MGWILSCEAAFSSFLPVFYFSKLVGSLSLTLKNNKSKKRYLWSFSSFLYCIALRIVNVMLFCWFLGFRLVDLLFSKNQYILADYVNGFNQLLTFTIGSVVVCWTISKSKLIPNFFETIFQFDIEFSTTKELHLLIMRKSCIHCFTVISLTITVSVAASFFYGRITNLIISWVYLSSASVICQFYTHCLALEERFKLLNIKIQKINSLSRFNLYTEPSTRAHYKTHYTRYLGTKIVYFRRTYGFLCDYLNALNILYEVPNLCIMFDSFLNIIFSSYYAIFATSEESEPVLILLVWCASAIFNAVSLSWAAQCCTNEVRTRNMIF